MDTNPIIPSRIAFYDLDGTPIAEVEGADAWLGPFGAVADSMMRAWCRL